MTLTLKPEDSFNPVTGPTTTKGEVSVKRARRSLQDRGLAKARPEKKRDKTGGAQPSLPGARESATPPATRLLPMQLTIGDRISDATGEWEVANRPHTTAGGKVAHVRVRRVDQPAVVEERTWGAHERVDVKRA